MCSFQNGCEYVGFFVLYNIYITDIWLTTNFTLDKEILLEEYAANKRWEFLPAMFFVGIFIIAGVLGNAFSFAYYGFKSKRTPSSLFISVLSAVDFISCLSMSCQIVNLYHYVTFKSLIGCRIYRMLTYFFIFSSAFMLVIISIDRYRKLCRPFKRQFTMLSSKVAHYCCRFCFFDYCC